jgi:hypothetical protein
MGSDRQDAEGLQMTELEPGDAATLNVEKRQSAKAIDFDSGSAAHMNRFVSDQAIPQHEIKIWHYQPSPLPYRKWLSTRIIRLSSDKPQD